MSTSFGALKQVDAGALSVGYAEVGPAHDHDATLGKIVHLPPSGTGNVVVSWLVAPRTVP